MLHQEVRHVRMAAAIVFLSIASMGTCAPAEAQSSQTKQKSIWEPVNVKQDVQLVSVRFTSPEEGWVAGGKTATSGGVILHTADAGATWEVQAGDLKSKDGAFSDLRFVDASTGFAVQAGANGADKLFSTRDGRTWSAVGVIAPQRSDYVFLSPETGMYSCAASIYRTSDAGKTWQRVFTCAVNNTPCSVEKLAFADAKTGYAITRRIEQGIVFLKTEDGGTTWISSVILPEEDGRDGALSFPEAATGILRTSKGRVYRTTDAGLTWTGVPGQIDGNPEIQFSDPDVGWMLRNQKMLYTVNGGLSWTSRDVLFPSKATAFSLVKRDSAYAVGERGMVYRYHAVPGDFGATGTLPAPAMPR